MMDHPKVVTRRRKQRPGHAKSRPSRHEDASNAGVRVVMDCARLGGAFARNQCGPCVKDDEHAPGRRRLEPTNAACAIKIQIPHFFREEEVVVAAT